MSRRSEISNIFIGIVLLILCHLAYLMLAGLIVYLLASMPNTDISQKVNTVLGISVLGIGLTQALYVVPLCLYLSKRRQHTVVKGVLIGAVLTMLLNGSCFLLFHGMLSF
jgi:amino acid permease